MQMKLIPEAGFYTMVIKRCQREIVEEDYYHSASAHVYLKAH